ncbi:MAG: RDD family protein [Leptolyngbyaceae cyanobacterium CSU_1_3]|nr:RDD family protein [Leptolyngbyaceae cyanobacterium CSU_1_3]
MSLFNRVTVQTPESVELEFTLAGIGNRTLALLIDSVVWSAILLVFLLVWGIVASQLPNYINSRNLQLWLTAIALLTSFAIYVGYFVFLETLWRGQTIGKRYAKIRVIRDDGQPAGLSQAILRALLRPIDDLFFLGMLCIILGKREKRLGDWAAGTIVVQNESPVVAATFQLSPKAQPLADELLNTAEIGKLLPDDFSVIREYLQRRTLMESKARSNLSLQLARQARQLIGLQDLPFQMTADLFLEAIYLAYQQQRS